MNRKQGALGAALASALGFGSHAQGAVYEATLDGVVTYSDNGSSAGDLGSSTATWRYDDTSGLLTQSGGTYDVRYTTSPTNTLFRHTIAGLIVGAGAPAAAATFVCTEGNFGAGVGASICGNYRFGSNFINESTLAYGPGTTVTRTLGGDDMGIPPNNPPPPQSIALYDGVQEQSLSGTSLAVGNSRCATTLVTNCAVTPDVINAGFDFALTLADASPDTAATAANTATAPIDVLANDPGVGDPVTVSILAPPDQGGSVAITNDGAACPAPCTGPRADLRLVLTPSSPSGAAAYDETFTYQVTDGVTTASAGVTVAVGETPVEEAPLADPLRSDTGGSALDPLALLLLGGAAARVRRRR